MSLARRILCLAAFVQAAALAQSDDPRALLLRVRESVTRTLSSLPRYLCTLTVDREQYARVPAAPGTCDALSKLQSQGARGRLVVTDRLRLDVAIGAANEIYSWVGEDRFDNRDVFQLVQDGALQTGAFSTFLSSIFQGDLATFSYLGDAAVDGRPLAEFGFEVPRERSNYVFGNRQEDSVVGYDGTFLVDPLTADLVRLTIRTNELPADTGACRATTTLDYARTHLNDSDLLLPRQVQLDILNITGDELRNNTVYSSCHEFVGESVLKFGDDPGSSAGANSAPAPALPETLPSGVAFQVRFSQDIDTKTVAAGDRILAELASPIRNPTTKAVLIPEGAKIAARIVKIQHLPALVPVVRMQVRLETVSLGASVRPLSAVFTSMGVARPAPASPKAPIQLGALDMIANPNLGLFEFRNADAAYVIRKGFESTWSTAAVHP